MNNLRAADVVLDHIAERCQLLARQPLMGRARPELGSDLRSFPVGRYVEFYRPWAGSLEVVRVLHGARAIGPTFQD